MLTSDERMAHIEKLSELPTQVEKLVSPMTEARLNAHPPGEWTVAQNIHHLADSHMNAFIRCKLGLTEDRPTIKPYDQDKWAALWDGSEMPVEGSLAILRGVHARWVALFRHLDDAQWARTIHHPESGTLSLEDILLSYVKQGQDHLQQITEALEHARG